VRNQLGHESRLEEIVAAFFSARFVTAWIRALCVWVCVGAGTGWGCSHAVLLACAANRGIIAILSLGVDLIHVAELDVDLIRPDVDLIHAHLDVDLIRIAQLDVDLIRLTLDST
jgi:hypothetical protein